MNSGPDGQSIIFQIILLIVLTALNAFFAASEMSLVSVNRARVGQRAAEGDKKYKKLLKIIENPSNFLSTIQVGITVINILTGASLADNLAARLAPLLGGTTFAKTAAQFIVLALLTYFSIVFGELYPKRVAQNLKERFAIIAVGPIDFLGKIMKPFVWLLSSSTNLLSRITPMKLDDDDGTLTRDEIEYLLNNNSGQAFDESEKEMLAGIFSMDELVAREIMVPRTEAFMIDINDNIKQNLQEIVGQVFSRVPIYDGDKDNVIGIVHTKNILRTAYDDGFKDLDLRKVMQEPLFVPESIHTDDLLRELKETQNHMAILLNEYGGVEGLVTLEDLLEEIVGEIEDESDLVEVPEFVKISDNVYEIQGRMTINDFNEEFDTDLESNDVDTMGGYFVTGVGTIPTADEHLHLKVNSDQGKINLTNLKMDGSRVDSLKVEFLGKEKDKEDDNNKDKEE